MDDERYKKYKSAVDLLFYEGQIGWQMNIVFIAINSTLAVILAICLNKLENFDLNLLGFSLSAVGIGIGTVWFYTFRRNSKYYEFRMAQAREIEPEDWNLIRGKGQNFSKGNGEIIESNHYQLTKGEKKVRNKVAMAYVIVAFIILYAISTLGFLINLFMNYEIASYWNNVIQNALGCAIGSVLGVGISLFIYYRQNKKDSNIRKQNELKRQNDILRFFAAMIVSIIRTSKQQIENIDDNIAKFKNDSVTFHLMSYVPLFDLHRIVENQALDQLMLAYTSFFKEEESLTDFRKIIDQIDYLYLEFKMLPDLIMKSQQYDYGRKKNFQEIYAACHKIITEFVISNGLAHPVSQKLQKIMLDFFHKRTNDSDIKFHRDNFFTPINDLCIELLDKGEKDLSIAEIGALSRDGNSIFESIQSHNKQFEANLEDINKNVKKSIEDLTSATTLLLNTVTITK